MEGVFMWRKMRELDKEVILGGVFGIIAITAIIIQTSTLGFSQDAIWAGIKDLATTLVAVMVFALAIRNFAKNTPKSLKGKFLAALKNWENTNKPLVFKVTGFQKEKGSSYTHGFAILQDQKEFLNLSVVISDEQEKAYSSYTSRKTGKFVDMPSVDEMLKSDFKVRFNFIESTYGDNVVDFVQKTCQCLNGRFKEINSKQS
jgi:hypothetical protein